MNKITEEDRIYLKIKYGTQYYTVYESLPDEMQIRIMHRLVNSKDVLADIIEEELLTGMKLQDVVEEELLRVIKENDSN